MFTDLIAPFGGFDDVFDSFNELIKSSRLSYSEPFPPVNVYTTSNDKMCTIDMALAGYTKDKLMFQSLVRQLLLKQHQRKRKRQRVHL